MDRMTEFFKNWVRGWTWMNVDGEIPGCSDTPARTSRRETSPHIILVAADVRRLIIYLSPAP